MDFLVQFVAATIRLATPLTLASIGGAFAELSGVITISLEGMMLMGAFAAFATSFATGSVWLGVLAAIVGGGVVGLAHGLLTIRLRADQIVTGIAVNLAVLGATAFLNDAIFGIRTSPPEGAQLSAVAIPFLSDIPFLGRTLFRQSPLSYLAMALVPVAWFVLYKTHWGLAVRSVGEHPGASDTAGLNVWRLRYHSVVLCGALCGLAGAFLTVGSLNIFVSGMTAGRGFIAYAAVVLGRWNPPMVAAGSLLFGAADALQLRMQGFGFQVPYQTFLMMPYVITLLVLALFARRARYPAAAGMPYP
jgi:ABC-type uncharacterized transport system permease subunit